jgi:hypothetical protein
MVAAYWQQPLLQDDVSRWLDTRGIGTPSSRIQRLSKRGFEVVYQTGSLTELERWVSAGVPCILFVRTGELDYWDIDTPHVVVLAGLEQDHAYLFDPAHETAPIRVMTDELLLAWSYSDYTFAVLYLPS